MEMERPDLSNLSPEILSYIEALEAELDQKRQRTNAAQTTQPDDEPPTTQQLISITELGLAKRTARHLYSRQRRGGMGVFDIEVAEDDRPVQLVVADQIADLLLLTDRGRAFRLPVEQIAQTEVRGRGLSLTHNMALREGEKLAAVLPPPDDDEMSLVLASERGWARRYRASFVGSTMFQGTTVHDVANGGALTCAVWSPVEDDLFMITEQGQAIRFPGRHVRDRRGCLGLRVDEGDRVIGIASVDEQSGVFMVGEDGKGTIRLMAGFRANKAPGAGGKTAIKAQKVVGAVRVATDDDLFVISRLGKIIRFAAQEVPDKTGVVQGVNIISLRADEATAVTAGRLAT